MAVLIEIILKKGQVMLSETTGGSWVNLDNSAFLFGIVALVCELTDMYEIGDVVLFDPVGANIVVYADITYYLTTEDKLSFIDTALS